ncbi:hypothetical protein AK812_SmicGene19280 [Symbiodinium microadriaticum]|uniref:Uncharacterized protein n=1 Tax=Symbiodinium microadriaticum TaxID=2951 RepID=A0A1Q9DSZ8_SYMMI|nr:hypothetical protein AK812_SmicGene19280 [Symbiodinium microadriaticum]CAE6953151.1 unnamed protein product [Symbiodinium sp. KB8]CAE7884710.1 unnamed protein product [Symbiodinium microadriaticum]
MLDSLEWRRLSKFASDFVPGMHGTHQNFLVQPFGAVASDSACKIVRAELVEVSNGIKHTGRKVVLRLRHEDWFMLEAPGPLRVIQAGCHQLHQEFVLDCTHPRTLVASYQPLVQESTVQVAEVFSGGFGGWAQGAYVLHRAGLPISTRWTLDIQETSIPMQQAQVPHLACVETLEDLRELTPHADEQLHINANVEHDWWLHCLVHRPINVLVASPPLQPWNNHEKAPGLNSSDGRLMLRIVDVAGAFGIPVVGIETCAGIFQHAHYPQILEAWSAAGYRLHLQLQLNLLDVLPCSRPRAMLVFVKQYLSFPDPELGDAWNAAKRSTLSNALAIFDHPPEIQGSLSLAPEVLNMYMDPWYLPPARDQAEQMNQLGVSTAAVCKVLEDQVCQALETGFSFSDPLQYHTTPEEFVPIAFQSQGRVVVLQVPRGIASEAVFLQVGLKVDAPLGCPQAPFFWEPITLSTAELPHLHCGGLASHCASSQLCTVLTAGQTFLIEPASPRLWPQLLCVFDSLSSDQEDLLCYSLCGQRLWYAEDFVGCIVAATLAQEAPELALSLISEDFVATKMHMEGSSCVITCPASNAMNFWLGFPFHLSEAVGWSAETVNFPCQHEQPMQLRLHPAMHRVHTAPHLLPSQLRIWYIVSRLEACRCEATSEHGHLVEVQIVAFRIWEGRLPASFEVDRLTDWWSEASVACAIPEGVRLFSGPHQLPEHTEGVDLSRTTSFVDAVSASTSSQKLFNALQTGKDEQKWQVVVDFAKEAGIPVPAGINLVARAEQRVRKTTQRKKQEGRMQVRAGDVCIAENFFQNEDGTTAAMLTGLRPGATGVLLADADAAAELMQTMKGVQPDELGLLVLGHACPCCAIEEGSRLSFPAVGRHCGSKLLLAGCLHSLGGKAVQVSKRHNVDVPLPDVLVCTFSLFADEWEAESWAAAVQAPVKTVVQAFARVGLDKILSEPWSRQFRLKGKASSPSLADHISFKARVDSKSCDTLLANSGHNHVYIVPRRQDQSLQSGYAIVWLGPTRAEAIKASLQVPGQLGLVRARDRYGLRVPESRHEAIFKQLRPGQAAPSKLDVKHLWRMGPVPANADAAAIQAWANGSKWTVKVLKALGPQHWLLGSQVEPPQAYPGFNGQTVMVTKVPQRAAPTPIVQSGHLQGRQTSAETPLSAPRSSTEEDPWLTNDPWAKAAFASTRTSFASLSATSTPSRQVTGPSEQRFQAQEARLQALEENLQTLKEQHEQGHAQLLQQQAVDRQTAQAANTALHEQQ